MWKYLDDGSDQGTAWKEPGFDDSAWSSGPARLGYGGDGEVTTVGHGPDANNKYITAYFRKEFTVDDASQIAYLVLYAQIDDGAVVYLNGEEIFRFNILGTGLVRYNDPAASAVPDEQTFFEYSVPAAALNTGANTLAVDVHQVHAQSSDLGFDLELVGRDAPVLMYEQAGANLRLSWPAVPTDWELHWASQPGSGATWSPVTSPLVVSDGMKSTTVSAGGAPRFYKLKNPLRTQR